MRRHSGKLGVLHAPVIHVLEVIELYVHLGNVYRYEKLQRVIEGLWMGLFYFN